MHKASLVLAAGADFRLLGPRATMLPATKPVVAVTAVRTGCGKSQTSRRVGEDPPRRRSPRRARPAPDAVRRSRGDGGPALRDARGHRRGASDHRGARGVRAAGSAGDDRLRGRRLRRDPRARRGGGRRHHLGRRQQRLLVLRARPHHRRRRSAARRARARLPPRRDEPPAGRRRRRQQDRERRDRRDRARPRGRPQRQPRRRHRVRALAGHARARARRSRASACSSSTTGRRSRTAAWSSAPAPSPRAPPARPSSSIRVRTRSARSPTSSRAIRTSTSCRRWATPTSSCAELEQTIDACDCDVVVTGTPIDLSRLIHSRHPIRHASYDLEETGGVAARGRPRTGDRGRVRGAARYFSVLR